jgi:uncharacterized membrane protein (DUF106 family)
MESQHNDHEQLQELLKENQRLIRENNTLLKSIKRLTHWYIWIKVIWFAVLIGLPLALYYYVAEPYFSRVQTSFQSFQYGLQEIPGWKQFFESIKGNETPGGE